MHHGQVGPCEQPTTAWVGADRQGVVRSLSGAVVDQRLPIDLAICEAPGGGRLGVNDDLVGVRTPEPGHEEDIGLAATTQQLGPETEVVACVTDGPLEPARVLAVSGGLLDLEMPTPRRPSGPVQAPAAALVRAAGPIRVPASVRG